MRMRIVGFSLLFFFIFLILLTIISELQPPSIVVPAEPATGAVVAAAGHNGSAVVGVVGRAVRGVEDMGQQASLVGRARGFHHRHRGGLRYGEKGGGRWNSMRRDSR